MSTFLEFYRALLRFVNFKLFTDLGQSYPPQYYQKESNCNSIYLDTVQIQDLQKIARKKFASSESVGQQKSGKYQISEEFKQTPEMQLLNQKEEQIKRQRELFNKCTFLLNRETPIYILQYLILSFGGSYATEEDVEYLKTHKVTHHVIDRPLAGAKLDSTKEYVQPQWIADSLNNLFLLPTQTYRPGQAPPPHLSPFVDNSKEGYVPTRQKEINQLKGEIVESEEEEENDDVAEEPVQVSNKAEVKPVVAKKVPVKGDADSSSEEEDSEDEAVIVAKNKQLKQAKNQKIKKELQKEQEELGKILMTKKQRQLFDQADKSNQVKKQLANKLKEKRNKIVTKK